MAPRPVLVVDDDPDIRETLRFVLEDAGYPVYSAENGSEALAILSSGKELPGLILLDLMMPVMSGDEMLRALKAVHALAQDPGHHRDRIRGADAAARVGPAQEAGRPRRAPPHRRAEL